MGAGSRLDVPMNLTSLCRLCHVMAESGKRVKEIANRLLEIVAAREGMTPAALAEILTKLKWQKKP